MRMALIRADAIDDNEVDQDHDDNDYNFYSIDYDKLDEWDNLKKETMIMNT